jgi:hypothetical protein
MEMLEKIILKDDIMLHKFKDQIGLLFDYCLPKMFGTGSVLDVIFFEFQNIYIYTKRYLEDGTCFKSEMSPNGSYVKRLVARGWAFVK